MLNTRLFILAHHIQKVVVLPENTNHSMSHCNHCCASRVSCCSSCYNGDPLVLFHCMQLRCHGHDNHYTLQEIYCFALILKTSFRNLLPEGIRPVLELWYIHRLKRISWYLLYTFVQRRHSTIMYCMCLLLTWVGFLAMASPTLVFIANTKYSFQMLRFYIRGGHIAIVCTLLQVHNSV